MIESYSTGHTHDRPAAWKGCSTINANLVLEGGSYRGQFTGGVLDFLMDQGVFCKTVIGTSAGALMGYNYKAGDIGHASFQNMKYCDDPRYISMQNLVEHGTAITEEFFFGELAFDLEPYSDEHLNASPIDLYTVASDIDTGEADYHLMETGHGERDMAYLRASCSMPMLCETVEVDGKRLVDGGVCDSVPLGFSMMLGNTDKHVVVLTRDAAYRKHPNRFMPVAHRIYSGCDAFLERMQYRHYEYNLTYRRIAKMADEGTIFLIRPQKPVEVTSMEKDTEKLYDLYVQGMEEAARRWDDLQRYLEL